MNSSIAAQNPILVNVYSSFNIYDYNPRDLWIVYGIAAGSALFSVVFDMYAIWRNGSTYRNVFSTFLRTTRDPVLQHLIDPSDNGAEPLPKDLAEVNITWAEDKDVTMQIPQRRSSEADARDSDSRETEVAMRAHAGQGQYDNALEMNDLESHSPTIVETP